MCLTKPVQIKKIKGQKAQLADGRLVDITLVKDIKVGDWVLTNNQIVIYKITSQEANDILADLRGGTK